MSKRLLKTFETARDSIFIFIIYFLLFLLILSIGVVLSIKAPSFFKFIGVFMIVGSFYFLTYYPTVVKLLKNNNN